MRVGGLLSAHLLHPTLAPGNLLPVGREDHSSPFSDDAHDGVPQPAPRLGVHARGGLILWGGREGRGLHLEAASPGYCALLGRLPPSISALWQTMHKVTPQWARPREPRCRDGRQDMNQESKETTFTPPDPFQPMNGLRLIKAMLELP